MNIFKLSARRLVFVLVLLASACNPRATPSNVVVPLSTDNVEERPPILSTSTTEPKPAISPFPTLAYDLQGQLYEYLGNNKNCELPCFLGITPGETSWTDANLFLETYSLNKPIESDQAASSQDYTVYYAQIQTSKDISLMLRVRLGVNERGVVQHINFDATSSRGTSYVGDDRHLSRYSLREILRRHGLPDSIYMKPIKQGVYSLHVVYDELKMVIGLTGRAKEESGGVYDVCPNLGEGNPLSLTIALANPSDPIDVKALIGFPFYESELLLEDASGLSPDEFYVLVTGDESPACFVVQ